MTSEAARPRRKSSAKVAAPLLEDGVEVIRLQHLPWFLEVRAAVKWQGCKIVWLPTAARAGKDRGSTMLVVEMAIELAIKRLHREFETGEISLVPRVNVWIVAPTKALWAQNWQEMLMWIPKSLITKCSEQQGVIMLKGGIRFSFKSADRPETLVSEGVDILLITEASRIRSPLVWGESLIPRLASSGRLGVALINGSPRNGRRHWFRMGCENAERIMAEAKDASKREGKTIFPRERVWQHPTWINPYMVDKIAMLKESMPAHLYRSEVEGRWPDEEAKPFPDAYVDRLFVQGGATPMGPFKNAIDVARFMNWTCGTRWAQGAIQSDGTESKPQLIAVKFIRNMRTGKQITLLSEFCQEGPGEVVVDCTGAHGATFQEGLEDKLHQPIGGYDFHGSRKEVLIEAFILAVEYGSFEIREDLIDPRWIKEMKEEFDGFDCHIKDDGTYEYSGEPDDFIISGALGWYLCQHGFGVSNWNQAEFLGRYF